MSLDLIKGLLKGLPVDKLSGPEVFNLLADAFAIYAALEFSKIMTIKYNHPRYVEGVFILLIFFFVVCTGGAFIMRFLLAQDSKERTNPEVAGWRYPVERKDSND